MRRNLAEEWADSPWMPPSPHREAVLERLAAGRAHIEEQGHGKPPLLVHEDGGILELPKARLGSWDLYAADRVGAPEGTTKHVDVCGTIDEIEGWLRDNPSGGEDCEADGGGRRPGLQQVGGACLRSEAAGRTGE